MCLGEHAPLMTSFASIASGSSAAYFVMDPTSEEEGMANSAGAGGIVQMTVVGEDCKASVDVVTTASKSSTLHIEAKNRAAFVNKLLKQVCSD